MSEPTPLPDSATEHTEVLHGPQEDSSPVSLAGEVVVLRHPDGMLTITVDGVNFPWFVAADPAVTFLDATEDRPLPVMLLPVLCGSIEVREVVPAAAPATEQDADEQDEPCCEDDSCEGCYEASLAEALEGLVVAHPGDES